MVCCHVTNDDVVVACQRLTDFALAGITVYFDKAVRLLARKFGWSLTHYEPAKCVAPLVGRIREDIPADVLKNKSFGSDEQNSKFVFAKSLSLREAGSLISSLEAGFERKRVARHLREIGG
jgi:hypothetical protein